MICQECGKKIVAAIHEESESDILANGPWIRVGLAIDRRVILRLHKEGEWATNMESRQGGAIDRYSGHYFANFSDAVMNLTDRMKDDLATNSQPGTHR